MATAIKTQKLNTVLSKITDANGRLLANLKFEIYGVGMRECYALSDTLTNKEGKYELNWTHEQLSGEVKRLLILQSRSLLEQKILNSINPPWMKCGSMLRNERR